MRFRFLGGQDCPDWLLCQISSFSKLSSIKFKRLCDVSVTGHLLEDKIDDNALSALLTDDIDLVKLHRFVVAIAYILRRAVGYQCSAEDLETEVTQLGLPLEHSKMLARSFTNNYAVMDKFIEKSIPKEKCFEVCSIKKAPASTTVEYTKLDQKTVCTIAPTKFNSFLSDMEKVLRLVDERFQS